jgi:membrane-associated PAP2 superfamily phosphatase
MQRIAPCCHRSASVCRIQALNALLRRDLLIASIGLALLLAWDASGLDLPVMRWVGSTHGFALREHWLTSRVLHDGTRWVTWIVALGLLVSIRWPFGAVLRALSQRERLLWLLTTFAAAAVVPLLKRGSLTSCPWDLAEFGGAAQYISHWRWGVPDGGGGRCFPSGHATTAFAWFSGGFALQRAFPKLACTWSWGVLAVGLFLGGVQLLRGAHYVSHTLWAAWLCWMVCAVVSHAARAFAAQRDR